MGGSHISFRLNYELPNGHGKRSHPNLSITNSPSSQSTSGENNSVSNVVCGGRKLAPLMLARDVSNNSLSKRRPPKIIHLRAMASFGVTLTREQKKR